MIAHIDAVAFMLIIVGQFLAVIAIASQRASGFDGERTPHNQPPRLHRGRSKRGELPQPQLAPHWQTNHLFKVIADCTHALSNK
jgi:hypothetical protein